MQVGEETSALVGFGFKILGICVSFVGGVVTATWIVATKVKGFDDRLQIIEGIQQSCPGKALTGIDKKLEEMPEKIDEKIEKKFVRVHERIDEIILRGNVVRPIADQVKKE